MPCPAADREPSGRQQGTASGCPYNVVRHANATEVRLRAAVTSESLSIILEDNGRGFTDATDDALADGLRNMRQRMTEIRGEFHLESRPGSGTSVRFVYPWTSTG